MTFESESCDLSGRRQSAPASHEAPASEARSTGTLGAELSELAVDGASAGATKRPPAELTLDEESRSPSSCVDSDATAEGTTMYNMLQRHEVQVLLGAGLRQNRIVELTGVSERTIRRIGSEEPVTQIDDGIERRKRSLGRPSKTAGFRELVKNWLKQEPELKSVELLHRMKQKGYKGKRSAAYDLIKTVRKRIAKYVMRFEGLPGEFTQHDFGEVTVKYTDGRRQKIHFFATRLKYSRWVEVTIVPNQRAETLIRAMLGHFAAIGGIPLLAVFDRPKTIAVEWRKDGTVTKWNSTFSQAMFGLGLGVELCWPYSPEQKALASHCTSWVGFGTTS